MSKLSAPYLSLGVFVKSESSDLNFRMPGLWPRNTMIYKWNSKGGDARVNNQGVSHQGQSRRRGSPGARNGNQYQGYQDNTATGYRYRTSEQQRLHDQNV